jgi:hypothetical protein
MKRLIQERKTQMEHVFGTLKRWAGKVPILLTSLKKVQIEINIYATTYNLKRLHNIESMANIMQKLQNYDFKATGLTFSSFFTSCFLFFNLVSGKKTYSRILVAQ